MDYPTNRWIKAFAVNVHAPFILAKSVLPDMVAAGRGAIRQYRIGVGDRALVAAPMPTRTVRGGVNVRRQQGRPRNASHKGLAPGSGAAWRYRRELRVALACSCRRPARSITSWSTALDDPRGEPPAMMGARPPPAAGQRAGRKGERPASPTGQQILKEFGLDRKGLFGRGVDIRRQRLLTDLKGRRR